MKASPITIIKIPNRTEDVNAVPTAFSALSLFPAPRLLEIIEAIPTPIIWEIASIICWIGKTIVKAAIPKLPLAWLPIKIASIRLYNTLAKNTLMAGRENLKSSLLYYLPEWNFLVQSFYYLQFIPVTLT